MSGTEQGHYGGHARTYKSWPTLYVLHPLSEPVSRNCPRQASHSLRLRSFHISRKQSRERTRFAHCSQSLVCAKSTEVPSSLVVALLLTCFLKKRVNYQLQASSSQNVEVGWSEIPAVENSGSWLVIHSCSLLLPDRQRVISQLRCFVVSIHPLNSKNNSNPAKVTHCKRGFEIFAVPAQHSWQSIKLEC